MKESPSFIQIEEYKYRDLSNINVKNDIPYLKKACFGYSDSPGSPYYVTELKDYKTRIENTSYAGIIQLDETRIYFSTKVQTNLFYMLSYLRDENVFRYDREKIIDIKEGQNFFDILGRLFLNELLEIGKKGFYKNYVKNESDINYLKGKLLINDQIQNNLKKHVRFHCRYYDLTFDNLENQIILYATNLLIAKISSSRTQLIQGLANIRNLMRDNVSLRKVMPGECEQVQLNRLNDYYETILRFSKAILLTHYIRSAQKGLAKGFNFIVNMNNVYENFITEMILEIIKEDEIFNDYVALPQERFDSLVRENKIITKPDIILKKKNSNEVPFIIDAKYKKQSNNADIYQVIAYALAVPHARACFLIYPKNEKIENTLLTLAPGKFDDTRADIPLFTLCVDLFLDEEISFKKYIILMKDQLRQQLLSCSLF